VVLAGAVDRRGVSGGCLWRFVSVGVRGGSGSGGWFELEDGGCAVELLPVAGDFHLLLGDYVPLAGGAEAGLRRVVYLCERVRRGRGGLSAAAGLDRWHRAMMQRGIRAGGRM